jgi:hypothetical protein
MAAGDTGVSICSDALMLLGAKAITSFNDGTDEVSVCDRLYPDIRDSALVMYPWTFGMKKVQLAQLITTPTASGNTSISCRATDWLTRVPCTTPPSQWPTHARSGRSRATSC